MVLLLIRLVVMMCLTLSTRYRRSNNTIFHVITIVISVRKQTTKPQIPGTTIWHVKKHENIGGAHSNMVLRRIIQTRQLIC
ncbi:hypothetical protein F5887DRAFT_939801 [Amanita rubescens]|nr:hypothetical protein F5887DRAFT_939801 [Amanita rubescens]